MKNHNGNTAIRWMVVLGDFILLNTVILLFIKFFPNLIPPVLDVKSRTFIFICNVAMAIAQYYFHSDIDSRHMHLGSFFSKVLKLVVCQTIFSFVFIRFLYNNGGMFKFMFYYAPTLFVILFAARIVERYVINLYRKRGGNTRKVVFIGSDPANILVYEEMMSEASAGYRVKGYYGDVPYAESPEGMTRLGNMADWFAYMKNTPHDEIDIDEVFCSMSHDLSEEIMGIMRFCDQHIIRFYYVPRMLGNYRLNLKAERFGNMDLYTNHTEPLSDPINRIMKRTFDIVFSFIACVFMIPVIPIIALITKRQSPGPIFFKQHRTGLNGKTFNCYKFRSMHVNERADTLQATINDPRKFPFGDFMRKYNIDELPQFFNVLIGNMSVVGPRPHMLHHTSVYSEIIEKYMVRHFYKPGITGWAQVTGYRGETKELWQMEERIKRDIWYIENWTLGLDIRIIFLTIVNMLRKDSKAY